MTDHLMPPNQNIKLVVHEIGDLLAAARSHSPSEMGQDFGEQYRELYWDWAAWNSKKRIALDIAPPDVGS